MKESNLNEALDTLETRTQAILKEVRAAREDHPETLRRLATYANALRHTLAALEPLPKCHKPVTAVVPRLGIFRACVLPKGHAADCAPGGKCYGHGRYIGMACPEQGRPLACVTDVPETDRVTETPNQV